MPAPSTMQCQPKVRTSQHAGDETLYPPCGAPVEWLFGIDALPAGRRKQVLDHALTELLALFKDRILPFDTAAARCYADLAMAARNDGRDLPAVDGYVAGIAASRGFIVASLDVSPYEAAGLQVINLWKAE
ncbi:MAG: VapC toxin family PIN domain ribonuclease [Moraxellaceae bacterium]|nr:VapC toxin family PIN domain ribonuclease [Moraxellaceae bacterium]